MMIRLGLLRGARSFVVVVRGSGMMMKTRIPHRNFEKLLVKLRSRSTAKNKNPARHGEKEGRHDIEKALRERSGSGGDVVGGDDRGAANTARCDGMETRDIQVPRRSVGRTTRDVLSHAQRAFGVRGDVLDLEGVVGALRMGLCA